MTELIDDSNVFINHTVPAEGHTKFTQKQINLLFLTKTSLLPEPHTQIVSL